MTFGQANQTVQSLSVRLDAAETGKADKTGTTDIEITDHTKGVILKSANGTRYRLVVADNGTLSTSAV